MGTLKLRRAETKGALTGPSFYRASHKTLGFFVCLWLLIYNERLKV